MTFAPSRLIDKLEGEFHLLSLECTIIDASLSSIVAEGAASGQIAFPQKRIIKAPKKRNQHHALLFGALREFLFSVRIQSISGKSLSANRPASGDKLDDDEGNRAQQEDMQKTSLLKNQSDSPCDKQHNRHDPDHLSFFSLNNLLREQ